MNIAISRNFSWKNSAISLLIGTALTALRPPAAEGAETAAFLKISPGARPIAMGEAFTAVADDLNALAWNPAGLAQMGRRETAFMHAELFADTRYDFLGYAHPLPGPLRGTAALGLARLSQGDLEGRDESRRPTGSFTASDTAFQLALGSRLGSGPMLGASIKYLQSKIGGAQAEGLSLDLGVLKPFRLSEAPVSVGLSVLNLGPGLRFAERSDDLPLTVSLGAGLGILSSMRLAADYRHRPRSGASQFGLGTEYSLLPALTLRAGYAARLEKVPAASGAGAFMGMGMGFGLRLGRAALDYSFTPAGELGHAQRLSLSTRF